MKAIYLLIIVISSCTVHAPFSDDFEKANYHLRKARHHVPALRDTVERVHVVRGASASFVGVQLPASYNAPIILRDSITDVKVLIRRDSFGYEVQANCPDIELKQKELPVQDIPTAGLSVWEKIVVVVLAILAAVVAFALGFILARSR